MGVTGINFYQNPEYKVNNRWGFNVGGVNTVGAVNRQPYTGEAATAQTDFSLTSKHGTSNQSQPIPGHDVNYVARTFDLLV